MRGAPSVRGGHQPRKHDGAAAVATSTGCGTSVSGDTEPRPPIARVSLPAQAGRPTVRLKTAMITTAAPARISTAGSTKISTNSMGPKAFSSRRA